MSGLHYDSVADMPESMRKLVEKQMAKKSSQQSRNAELVKALTPDAKETVPKNKYHALPTERLLENGTVIKFGSKKEAAYYDYVSLLQKNGTVRGLKLQYQYLIKPAYTDGSTGERFRAISYLADFVYEKLEDGKWVQHIIDTKGGGRRGTKTKEYIIKRKLLAEKGIIIEEA